MPLQMGKRVSERATRGGEGRNTAVVSGHRIHVVRLGKPSEPVRTRRLRSLGSWRSRARRLVGLVSQRRGGPPAHRPSGRGPGCGFASDRTTPPPTTKPSRGWLRVVVRKPRLVLAEIRATWNKVTAKARAYCRGCAPSAGPFFRMALFRTPPEVKCGFALARSGYVKYPAYCGRAFVWLGFRRMQSEIFGPGALWAFQKILM